LSSKHQSVVVPCTFVAVATSKRGAGVSREIRALHVSSF